MPESIDWTWWTMVMFIRTLRACKFHAMHMYCLAVANASPYHFVHQWNSLCIHLCGITNESLQNISINMHWTTSSATTKNRKTTIYVSMHIYCTRHNPLLGDIDRIWLVHSMHINWTHGKLIPYDKQCNPFETNAVATPCWRPNYNRACLIFPRFRFAFADVCL